jgi:hypothetical protein
MFAQATPDDVAKQGALGQRGLPASLCFTVSGFEIRLQILLGQDGEALGGDAPHPGVSYRPYLESGALRQMHGLPEQRVRHARDAAGQDLRRSVRSGVQCADGVPRRSTTTMIKLTFSQVGRQGVEP